MKRGGRPADPITQPAEVLEPDEYALDEIARALECDVLSIQRTRCLLGRNAPPDPNERSEAVIVDKPPEPEAAVAIVGEQSRFGGFRRLLQDAAQDRRWGVDGGGQASQRTIVVMAWCHADGQRSSG